MLEDNVILEDFPNYSVNKYGEVFGLNGKLKPTEDKDGYLVITLYNNGVKKQFRVHRIIATAFVPNPNKETKVNHKNEDKKDNRSLNLEWCSVGYNNSYGTRLDRVASKLSKEIEGLDLTTGNKIHFKSLTEAERNGFTRSLIRRSIKKGSIHAGYKWRFVNA